MCFFVPHLIKGNSNSGRKQHKGKTLTEQISLSVFIIFYLDLRFTFFSKKFSLHFSINNHFLLSCWLSYYLNSKHISLLNDAHVARSIYIVLQEVSILCCKKYLYCVARSVYIVLQEVSILCCEKYLYCVARSIYIVLQEVSILCYKKYLYCVARSIYIVWKDHLYFLWWMLYHVSVLNHNTVAIV